MATTNTKFNNLSEIIAKTDFSALTINLALVASTYTFDATDAVWADMSADEVATGAGYTTGGATLANLAVTETGGTTTIDADNVTWSALTKTFRGAVAYASGTVMSLTNPVLFYILFDDTPADTVISGIDFVVQWPAAGIITL